MLESKLPDHEKETADLIKTGATIIGILGGMLASAGTYAVLKDHVSQLEAWREKHERQHEKHDNETESLRLRVQHTEDQGAAIFSAIADLKSQNARLETKIDALGHR